MNAEIGILVNQESDDPICFNDCLIKPIINNDRVEFEAILQELDIEQLKDARDYKGLSVLHLAADCKSKDIIEYLIALGFNVNLQDNHGRTALIIAIRKQYFAITEVLLNLDADICICDTFGNNALRILTSLDVPIVRGSTWLAEYWHIVGITLDRLEKNHSFNSEIVADELLKIYCPLTHVVFMKNTTKVMRIMIQKGSPINATDCFRGQTALSWAVEYWKLDLVKILLENGADINALNYYKKTPLMCIYNRTHSFQITPSCEIGLLKILLQHNMKLSSMENHNIMRQMYHIFRYGSKDAVQIALETREDLFLVKDKRQFSLLHILAGNSNPGIEEVIKDKKIDLDGKNNMSNTALSLALMYDNYNIAEYLVRKGASLHIKNDQGISPIHLPFMTVYHSKLHPIERRMKFLKLALEFGADLEDTIDNVGSRTTIIELLYNKHDFVLAELVLARFAIEKTLGIPMSNIIIYEQIQSHKKFKTFFDLCVKQLEECKTSIIFKSVTKFKLLTASYEMLSIYSRNRGLVSNLSKLVDQLELNSYYMELLQKYSLIILNLAELREKAENIICQNMGMLYEYNVIVTDSIVNYLDDEDIEKLL